MKFEKINDKQIRCTLTSIDLSLRNLGPAELAYGNSKVRDLFSEMMQKASQELGFEADGTPVMIEAIPQADQSVVLVITKVEDPEELDARFSRFSEFPNQEQPGYMPMPTATGQIQITQVPIQLDLTGPKHGIKFVFVFENLDKAIEAAKALKGVYLGQSSLYKNPETKEYFLTLRDSSPEDPLYLSTCNLLSEYGRLTLTNYSGDSYYDEHYETIIKNKALIALSQI